MKKSPLSPLLLGLTLCLLTGCSRFSIWQKSAMIVTTAGTASTVILTNNYATAGASVAGGVGTAVLGGTATMIIDSVEATPSQINAAEEAGKRYLAALDADRLKHYQQKGKNVIALRVKAGPKARGEGSVMLFDTQKKRVQSKKVYELRTLPKVGDTLVLEFGEVEYLGMIPIIDRQPRLNVATPVEKPIAADGKP